MAHQLEQQCDQCSWNSSRKEEGKAGGSKLGCKNQPEMKERNSVTTGRYPKPGQTPPKVHPREQRLSPMFMDGFCFFSLLGITPIAEHLGYATEQLAYYTGPTIGGLLKDTFGNATEMIISMYALKNGMIRVVQQSLV